MFVSDCLGVNDQGHLTIGGCDTLKLAETFGTPLYVMDEEQIRRNCRQYRASIETCYQGRGFGTVREQGIQLQGDLPDCPEEGLGAGCGFRRGAVYSDTGWFSPPSGFIFTATIRPRKS